MIIGLTGSYGAGKDTIADYLAKKGFMFHSLSDILRNEARKQNLTLTRENLIQVGNSIRNEYGAGELAKRTLEIIKEKDEDKSLVVSLRNPEEVRVLKSRPDFQMWFVDAPSRIRYDRTVKRQRSDDFSSFEDFIAKENMENSNDPNAQQLNKVAEMADVKIINNSSIEELYSKVNLLLADNENKDKTA